MTSDDNGVIYFHALSTVIGYTLNHEWALNKCAWIVTCFWFNAEGRNSAVFMHETIRDFSIGSFISIICMDLQHKCSCWLIFQNWSLLLILCTLWERKKKKEKQTVKEKGKQNIIRLFTLLRCLPTDQITSGQPRCIIVYTWWKYASQMHLQSKFGNRLLKAGSLRATVLLISLVMLRFISVL